MGNAIQFGPSANARFLSSEKEFFQANRNSVRPEGRVLGSGTKRPKVHHYCRQVYIPIDNFECTGRNLCVRV